jgi:haloalkane dehalogenase
VSRRTSWRPSSATASGSGTARFPKLFVNAEPGALIVAGRLRALCRSFPNQREVTVRGIHFVQEDSPQEIGEAIRGWIEERA